ncbi:hypothetical protein B0T14DRAFT_540128 [Immersiella caudata]|uniref:Hemerythrin-like domain-containing protein n=1 Tax=Immersiella caudata TaxID=314043 RepID=A0AA39W477_9PEZI|nr:hypothetical protein B0T14DRAFT_540128 [Immersiella caudata]
MHFTARTEPTSSSPRVSESINRDHRELEKYYNNMMVSKDLNTIKRWQNQFTWGLARHSIAEEIVVYPAFETHLSNGMEMAEKDRSQHQIVKEQLYTFQDLDPSSSEFMPTLQGMWATLTDHIKEEETEDLPALEKALDESESQDLAMSFSGPKHFVPTHSHPNAPNKPPYETVAGMLATPMDKMKDMFKKFPKEEKGTGSVMMS